MNSAPGRRASGRKGRRATGQDESGQALVEFALIVPILALLVMMVVDFGRVYAVQVALINAAREGARYCALHQDDASGTLARVTEELDGTVGGVTASGCASTVPGNPVTVTVRAPFVLVSPILCSLMTCIADPGPPPKQMVIVQATATMVVW